MIAYTIRQSFVPGEITPEEANRLGCELARRFTKGNHAFIVCTHIDKSHIHNHIIWNSTTLDYAALSEKTSAASTRYKDLSEKIKAAETHMAEIAALKTHIVNYSKTRDVYVAYRKSGYSKKFLAEHESEIILHKAAKKAFDGLGIKKLPTVKSLQAEYAALLAEKKAAYADYRKARDDMKELLTIKANVQQILMLSKEQKILGKQCQEQKYFS